MYDIRGASLRFVYGNKYVHGGYGRVYTVYDFGVDLDNWIMYVCYFLT